MNSQELVRGLSERLGLPGLQADPQQGCALSFPDGLKVDLRFGAGATALCFIATLGTLAAPARARRAFGPRVGRQGAVHAAARGRAAQARTVAGLGLEHPVMALEAAIARIEARRGRGERP